MFTGLIEDIGSVSTSAPLGATGGGRRLGITARVFAEDPALGASIAVDGVCLTVVAWQEGQAQFDVGPETLERTTLGRLAVGARVNLERALRAGDRLGGHLVAGHVDGVGRILARTPRGEAVDVRVSVPPPLVRYVIEKGSICVDGISLTVNAVDAQSLSVSLIPHTQALTTLEKKAVGGEVNLEVDLVGKYVEKLVAPYAAASVARSDDAPLRQLLKESGFERT